MARHQIIYTSCMRGIDGVNDGQQIYSYDASFSASKSDEVKSLFTYQVPSLQPGVIMTEALALTMPESFSYRLLKMGSASLTLNTYLGRDYMGSAGRFGNHLCHSVVCDFYDMDVYPCEIYGSSTLRSSMEYSEVNSSAPPAYLPEAVLEKGYTIDPDIVVEFLGIGKNLDYFKKMVCAMLRFQTEKKRIVICDEKENIIMWIAALHYSLPLEIAKKVNFTTYEFDPELSPAQICGVINQGSRYNAGGYVSSGRHYVFDFINSKFNEIEPDNNFVIFLDTAFSFSYESLTEFQEFVTSKTTYREANEEYYAAYELYSLLTEGISELSLIQFQNVIAFSEKYAADDMKLEIVSRLIEESLSIDDLNSEYALVIIQFMLKALSILSFGQQQAVKQLIVNRLIVSLSDVQIMENDFLALYDNIDRFARIINLSIPAELMEGHNRQALLNVMAQRVAVWKIYFLVRIISDYVKDTRMPIDELYPDRAIGGLYFNIIKAIYKTGRNNGYTLIEKILNNFKDNGTYLVNMAWNIEGFLNDLHLEEMDKKHLWKYFTQLVLEMNNETIKEINSAFMEYERTNEMFALYKARMEHEKNLIVAREIFKDAYENWFAQNYNYAYSEKVLQVYAEAYEKKIKSLSNEDSYLYAKEILYIAKELKIEANYVDLLIQGISEYLPLEKPSRENANLIVQMQEYQYIIRNKKVDGKLLLLCIGMYFDKITSKRDIEKYTNQIFLFADERGADVTRLGEKRADEYWSWILVNPLKYSLNKDDYSNIFQLFTMSRSIGRQFMEQVCVMVFKKSKEKKDYKDFAEFLKFMFEQGTTEDIENTGKYLCKLSKKNLDELDKEMKNIFGKDKKFIFLWNKTSEIASSKNPLLNNLTELFVRKKDKI